MAKIVDFPGSRRVYEGAGGETLPQKGQGAWGQGKETPKGSKTKSTDKDVIGAPRKLIDTEGLPNLGGEEKEPAKRLIGPYNRIELPASRPVIRRGPNRLAATDDEKRYRSAKNERFAGEIGSEDPEAGRLFKSTSANRVDPEPNRTLTGKRSITKPPAALSEQRKASEAGDSAAYWDSVAHRGAASDLGAKNNVGGFCTNCDAGIPDVQAATPKPDQKKFVPVYAGPGKPPRMHPVSKGVDKQVKFESSKRDDTLCAGCAPVSKAVTSSGQQELSEQFGVQRPRG
jgi:hypothetical protein